MSPELTLGKQQKQSPPSKLFFEWDNPTNSKMKKMHLTIRGDQKTIRSFIVPGNKIRGPWHSITLCTLTLIKTWSYSTHLLIHLDQTEQPPSDFVLKDLTPFTMTKSYLDKQTLRNVKYRNLAKIHLTTKKKYQALGILIIYNINRGWTWSEYTASYV